VEPLNKLGQKGSCAFFFREIMLTGYAILFCLGLIAATSYYRNKIPYEIFYGVHHLTLMVFAISILHTLDDKVREGISKKQQTFRWFASTLAYYFMDRIYMYMMQRFACRATVAESLGKLA